MKLINQKAKDIPENNNDHRKILKINSQRR